MKATIDIPDALYRGVKARSALEGRSLRAVAIELFQKWLEAPGAQPSPEQALPEDPQAPWLAVTRRFLRPGMSHDLKSIREAIAEGWAANVAEDTPGEDRHP